MAGEAADARASSGRVFGQDVLDSGGVGFGVAGQAGGIAFQAGEDVACELAALVSRIDGEAGDALRETFVVYVDRFQKAEDARRAVDSSIPKRLGASMKHGLKRVGVAAADDAIAKQYDGDQFDQAGEIVSIQFSRAANNRGTMPSYGATPTITRGTEGTPRPFRITL